MELVTQALRTVIGSTFSSILEVIYSTLSLPSGRFVWARRERVGPSSLLFSPL